MGCFLVRMKGMEAVGVGMLEAMDSVAIAWSAIAVKGIQGGPAGA